MVHRSRYIFSGEEKLKWDFRFFLHTAMVVKKLNYLPKLKKKKKSCTNLTYRPSVFAELSLFFLSEKLRLRIKLGMQHWADWIEFSFLSRETLYGVVSLLPVNGFLVDFGGEMVGIASLWPCKFWFPLAGLSPKLSRKSSNSVGEGLDIESGTLSVWGILSSWGWGAGSSMKLFSWTGVLPWDGVRSAQI